MAKAFRCAIVTPTAAVFDDEVTYATFPAWDGQQGVLAGQSPLLTKLGIGALRIDFAAGESRRFLIDGGFAQVRQGSLTLLTQGAEPAETLSLEEADAQLAEANARVAKSGEDLERVEHDQQYALAKRAIAKTASSG
jgi:F-type H+-transporting ATPase subunit epsilon